jgi:hypothetical protein
VTEVDGDEVCLGCHLEHQKREDAAAVREPDNPNQLKLELVG